MQRANFKTQIDWTDLDQVRDYAKRLRSDNDLIIFCNQRNYQITFAMHRTRIIARGDHIVETIPGRRVR